MGTWRSRSTGSQPTSLTRPGPVRHAHQSAFLPQLMLTFRTGKHGFHLQAKSCAAWVSTLPAPSEGPPVSRCHECIAKRSGFICCFQGVRSFPLDAEGRVLPYPVFRDFEGDDEKATLPTVFNGPLTAERGALLRSAIAEHSQASLKAEVDHAERPESVRLPKQLGTTYTCDGCATSILFASWMCTTCAREFCRECRDELETLPIEEIRQRAGSRRLFTPGPRGDIGGTNVYTVDKLTRCVSTDRHGLEQWIPIVRIDRVLLRQTVANMTWWKVNRPLSVPGPLTQELLDYHFVQPDAMEVSLKYLKVPGRYLPPMLGSGPDLALQATRSGMTQSHDVLQTDRTTLPSGFHSLDKAALPVQLHSFAAGLASSAQTGSSRQLRRPGAPPPLSKALSPLDLFSALWQRGCPVVVDLAPEHYPSLPWDPDFFVERFGAERCRIGSARVKQTLRDGTTVDCERNATVGDFFASFGKARDHSDIEKIKVSTRCDSVLAPAILKITNDRIGRRRETSRSSTRICGKMCVPHSALSRRVRSYSDTAHIGSLCRYYQLDASLAVTARSTSQRTCRPPPILPTSVRKAISAKSRTPCRVGPGVQSCTVRFLPSREELQKRWLMVLTDHSGNKL